MKGIRILTAAVAIAGLAFLAGCGGGVSGGAGATDEVAKSSGCVVSSCHGSIASTVTGRAIGEEWRASTHFATDVAGCTTCHGHSHQTGCASCHGGGVPQNQALNQANANDKCFDCHVSGATLMKALGTRHLPELKPNFRINPALTAGSGYNNYTSAGYVVMQGTPLASKCVWCHNPHDNRVKPQHNQWAESGHGETTSSPFNAADFKMRGSDNEWSQAYGTVCVRCHTTTGFVNLVTSNMKDVRPWGRGADGTPIATTKQTIFCNACHDNNGKAYGYNLRSIPNLGATGGVRIYYNYSAVTTAAGLSTLAAVRISDTVDYPNIGISDRCLLCHSGRGTGKLIKDAGTKVDANGRTFSFSNNSRIGMHDFAGGASMFRRVGFEYYSSFRYEQPAGITYIHDQIGVSYPGTGSRGPCVTCHMSSGEAHSFMPVSFSAVSLAVAPNTSAVFPSGTGFEIASINTSVCSTCHSSGKIGFSNFSGTRTDLTTKKSGYHAALRALFVWLNKKQITSSADWLKASTYTWNAPLTAPAYGAACSTVGQDAVYFGSRNMGASFNYDFLKNDPGAYVHNDLYAKRLIYDTLDWIDDCQLNNTVDRAITDAGNATYFGATISSGLRSSLTAEEVTSALNYLLGVPNVNARPGGTN